MIQGCKELIGDGILPGPSMEVEESPDMVESAEEIGDKSAWDDKFELFESVSRERGSHQVQQSGSGTTAKVIVQRIWIIGFWILEEECKESHVMQSSFRFKQLQIRRRVVTSWRCLHTYIV